MKRWLLWTAVGTLTVAIAVHLITLAAIPIVIMNGAMSRYPANMIMRGARPNAQSRGVVRPSPDLVYSVVSYDVSKGPVRFTAKVPTDTYWSVSMFQENTDNFFVINDSQVKSNPVEILIVNRDTQPADAGKAQIVVSPSPRGTMLVRHLLLSDDKLPELINIQKQSSLELVGSSRAPTVPAGTGNVMEAPPLTTIKGGPSFEATQYTNSAYGFSIQYPKAWKEAPPAGKQVFVAAAATKVPALTISVRDEPTFAQAVNAALSDTGSTEINISPSIDVKLADGTTASQSALKFTLKAGYPADALALGVQRDGKWIIATLTTVTMAAPYNEAQFSEILQTLKLNK
jgi:uncharacterized membrane protein